MYIIHSGKHLSNGKTTIVYTEDGRKRVNPDDETPPLEAFLTALYDMAIHFAVISGLARTEDYIVEKGDDETDRPKFKNPGFAKLFSMTGFSIDKKGMLTLTCTWKGGKTPTTINMNNINTNFESKAGYDYLQDLIEQLAQFRFQCGKFLDGAAGEKKVVAPPKEDPKKRKEPEIPFGTPGGTDVTGKYIGPDNELIRKDGDGTGTEEMVIEPLETFQNNTARTADQSKPAHLGRGGSKGQEPPKE